MYELRMFFLIISQLCPYWSKGQKHFWKLQCEKKLGQEQLLTKPNNVKPNKLLNRKDNALYGTTFDPIRWIFFSPVSGKAKFYDFEKPEM